MDLDSMLDSLAEDAREAGHAMFERVFEAYFRLDMSSAAKTTGTGLGLAIATSIAAAHGGTLVLRTRTNGGLDAVLTLQRDS